MVLIDWAALQDYGVEVAAGIVIWAFRLIVGLR
jgi:hypothetical protein